MNLTTRGMTVTTLTAAAVAIAAGIAQADATPVGDTPQTFTVDPAPGVRYSDSIETGAAVLNTPLGSVALQAGRFDIRDATGHTVAGTPIQDAAVAAANVPAAPAPSASTAAVAASATPVAGDLLSDLNQSVEAANPHMGAAMAVGSTVGSLAGAVIGCPFGIATGGTFMSLVSVGTLTVPALAASCIIGAVTVGGVGAVAGGLALAIPVGVVAGTQKFGQLQAQHAADAAAKH